MTVSLSCSCANIISTVVSDCRATCLRCMCPTKFSYHINVYQCGLLQIAKFTLTEQFGANLSPWVEMYLSHKQQQDQQDFCEGSQCGIKYGMLTGCLLHVDNKRNVGWCEVTTMPWFTCSHFFTTCILLLWEKKWEVCPFYLSGEVPECVIMSVEAMSFLKKMVLPENYVDGAQNADRSAPPNFE